MTSKPRVLPKQAEIIEAFTREGYDYVSTSGLVEALEAYYSHVEPNSTTKVEGFEFHARRVGPKAINDMFAVCRADGLDGTHTMVVHAASTQAVLKPHFFEIMPGEAFLTLLRRNLGVDDIFYHSFKFAQFRQGAAEEICSLMGPSVRRDATSTPRVVYVDDGESFFVRASTAKGVHTLALLNDGVCHEVERDYVARRELYMRTMFGSSGNIMVRPILGQDINGPWKNFMPGVAHIEKMEKLPDRVDAAIKAAIAYGRQQLG